MSPRVAILVVVVLVLPVLAAVSVMLWVRAWRRLLATPDHADQVTSVRTADGESLVLGRYLPVGTPSPRPPVLLCHGFAMNRRALAMDPANSLARVCAQAGRDVWVVELRGAQPGPVDPGVRSVSFDTYAALDIPAAIAHVCAATGVTAVDWVGFSMGGMLAYAHLGARRGGGIRRLVTVGSPMGFREVAPRVGVLRHLLRPLAWRARTPFGFLATLVAPLMWPGMPLALTHGLRGEHYDRKTLREVMANTLADAPAGVTAQFVRWIRDGRITSDDGAWDYLAGLGLIDVPTLVIAGSADRLATPEGVRAGYDGLRSEEKSYVEVGAASGAHADYDHLDLILGRRCRDEVFPQVLSWLAR